MKELEGFSILLRNLKENEQVWTYHLDEHFFKHFEQSMIGASSIDAQAGIIRRSDHLTIAISHKGSVKTSCDRCAEVIDLPIEGEASLMVKLVGTVLEDDAEILYLSSSEEKLNLAPIIYEMISLSLPMVRTYDCDVDENAPCNKDVLKYLAPEAPSGSADDSVWQDLKKLKL
ncbi:MAG: DUF177 domain-containing protein [Saprospiraceae bacterium]|nr:DUF177 domain-containing protein [Saprospiraceae bacterium]